VPPFAAIDDPEPKAIEPVMVALVIVALPIEDEEADVVDASTFEN